MSKFRKSASLTAGLLAILIVAPANGFNLNKSITIEAGGQSSGESTINGSISVGRDATVTGDLETVNGSIRIDESARIEDAGTVNGALRLANGVTAQDISSVNGTVELGENVVIDGEISVVNGRISIGSGSEVSKDVSNVNGAIQVRGTTIGGDLATVNGDVTLTANSVLRGDLIVEKPNSRQRGRSEKRKPKVVIGPGVRIHGEIELKREVELYISESAEVGGVTGVMTLEQAIRFSGENP
jgi:cytoskeletal protein CcmA (bactofilin family)